MSKAGDFITSLFGGTSSTGQVVATDILSKYPTVTDPAEQTKLLNLYRYYIDNGAKPEEVDALVRANLHPDIAAQAQGAGVFVSQAERDLYNSLSFWDKMKYNVNKMNAMGIAIVVGIIVVIVGVIYMVYTAVTSKKKGGKY